MRRAFCISTLALILAPLLAEGADFALSGTNTTITFVGTKPNGQHEGGFKDVSGSATIDSSDPTTLKISVDIDMNSLWSDNPKLTAHLKSPDFFGVKSNPTSKFVTTKVEKSADGAYVMTGTLTMLGKSNPVTMPARISIGGEGLVVTSMFTIDRTQWGMTYGAGKIDNAVKLTVSVKAK
jgi:polyisoprenoid-binding protein YceI